MKYVELSIDANIYLSICNIVSFCIDQSIKVLKFQLNIDHTAMYDIFLLTLLQFVPTNFANYDFLFHVYTLICFINRINFNVFNVYSYEINVV